MNNQLLVSIFLGIIVSFVTYVNPEYVLQFVDLIRSTVSGVPLRPSLLKVGYDG